MAINYTKIGWDTSKYVNPTNMNQMDNGIKAACDGVDEISANYIKATSSTYQTISVPSDMPAMFKRSNNATKVSIGFENSNGVLGTLGISASKKPIFNDGTDHEIALKENVASSEHFIFGYISTNLTIPNIPNSPYVLFAIKNQYNSSFIATIDSDGARIIAGNTSPTITRTINADNTITLTFTGASYFHYILITNYPY